MMDMDKLYELDDIAEGVAAVPMPSHLDREKVIRETNEAIKKLLSDSAQDGK